MSRFVEIAPEAIEENLFHLIGKEWMLVTAGQPQNFNTMTASWGGAGNMWNAPFAAAVVRPSRHTYGFMEQEEYYTLSFLGEAHRAALQLCGRVSGRDTDKVTAAGLTPRFDAPAPYFEEAHLVLVCRKRYVSDIDPQKFLDASIATHYQNGDYHRMYLGEIVKVLQKSE